MKSGRISALALIGTALALGGCASVNNWLFGGVTEQDLSRPPPGATAYQCDADKRLFVRYLENGAAAWVILPEREFRLNKITSASGTRYSNGNSTLETSGAATTLWDGASVTYAGCKASGG